MGLVKRLHGLRSRTDTAAFSFEAIHDAERDVIGKERQKLNLNPDGKLVGLAFSGGGIRSATFNLGILQGLADLGLLSHFDYLSTVSGGGYIGSWLLARMKHGEKTIAEVQQELSPEESPDVTSPAWGPIQFLQDYSNYLTPQRGLLSVDTWLMVALWLRNTILMQIVLILALSAVLLVPRLAFFITQMFEAPPPQMLGFAAACFFIPVAVCVFGLQDFGSAGPRGRTATQSEVLCLVVAPIFVLCWFSAALIMVQADAPQNRTAKLVILTVGVAVAVGLLIIQGAAGFGTSLKKTSFALISGFVAASLTFTTIIVLSKLHERVTPYWDSKSATNMATVFGPIVSIAVLSLVLTIYIGLFGNDLKDGQREWISRVGAWLNIVGVSWLIVSAIAIYAPNIAVGGLTIAKSAGLMGWLISTIGGLISGWSSESGNGTKRDGNTVLTMAATYAPYIFVFGLLILLACGLDWTISTANITDDFVRLSVVFSALAVLAYLLSRRFDLNEFSMHHFYKNRLVRCYLGAARNGNAKKPRSADAFTGFDPADDIPLAKSVTRPYPILNTTLNLIHGERLAWQERKAASFIMSPKFCGYDSMNSFSRKETLTDRVTKIAAIEKRTSLETHGYRPTSSYAGGLYLGTAMAVSGAAVNPNMGSFGSSATAFLMTAFNVRLGWWLGNPRHKTSWIKSSPAAGIFYLGTELAGAAGADHAFVNLSDGGHFENLGIYELIRRRCPYIVACDGSQDSDFVFEDLGNAIRRCRTDFGVEIEIDLRELRRDDDGLSHSHCAVGRISYPASSHEREATSGVLVYIKSSLTGDEPCDVIEYSRLHREFPHQSTADQWFDESQFESYRQLGYHIAKKVFARSGDKIPPKGTIESVFQDLWKASTSTGA